MTELPILPGHVLYLVTPSGELGRFFPVAIGDLLELSSWFVAAFAVSEKGKRHMHYLVAMEKSNERWLRRHPTIIRSGRRIPCVNYSLNDEDSCLLSFSKVTNVDGLRRYLEGPKNRAVFISFLDLSPRAVGYHNPDISPKELKKDASVHRRLPIFPQPSITPLVLRAVKPASPPTHRRSLRQTRPQYYDTS